MRDRLLAGARINTTDPESRIMKGPRSCVQGYNAQAAVTEDQIIVAAHLTQDEADRHQLHPMVERAAENLARAGVEAPIGSVLADAGYACKENLLSAEGRKEEARKRGVSSPEFFIATKKAGVLARESACGEEAMPSPAEGRAPRRKACERGAAARRMEEKLKTEPGREIYAKRGKTIEPVFGQLKAALRFDRFMRRGLDACYAEWMPMCAAHNLLKLWRFQTSPTAGG